MSTKRKSADYLAAARNSDVYKRHFKSAYDDPKKAMLDVGRKMSLGRRGPVYFKVEGPKDEPPYETNYSKVAEQIRQELARRDLNPRSAQKQGSGRLVGHSIVGDLIKDLALTEALESHEQQGKRFIRAHRPVVEEGYPKSTRSQEKAGRSDDALLQEATDVNLDTPR